MSEGTNFTVCKKCGLPVGQWVRDDKCGHITNKGFGPGKEVEDTIKFVLDNYIINVGDLPDDLDARCEDIETIVPKLVDLIFQREQQARRDELEPLHAWLQKPDGYDDINATEQVQWVILQVGKIGSHLDKRLAELAKEDTRG